MRRYLVRADGLDRLSAAEDTDRHDYVVFAEFRTAEWDPAIFG